MRNSKKYFEFISCSPTCWTMLLSELCYSHCEGAKAVLVVIVWKGVYFYPAFRNVTSKGLRSKSPKVTRT